MKEIHVGGLRLYCFGTEDLESKSKISLVFFAHGRLETPEKHFELCQNIHEYCSSTTNLTIVITIDHRNHGTRVINNEANSTWKENNLNHALDMWSIQYGTAKDFSYLMDILPAYFKVNINSWGMCGFSLGGHTTLLALANEPRYSVGVSIVGCADYLSLMKLRYKLVYGLEWDTPHQVISFDSLVNSNLVKLLEKFDSVNRIDQFNHKKLLMIFGEKDNLVPLEASQPFLDKVNVNVFIEAGVGHLLTDTMKLKLQSFLKDYL